MSWTHQELAGGVQLKTAPKISSPQTAKECERRNDRGSDLRRKTVRSCAVKLPLIAHIAVDCVFWAEDDGWKGVCEDLSILVWGLDFEESKEHMETVLKTYVRSLFREHSVAA